MTRFNDCLTFTLQQEGGYSDNPADHGGATDYGITQGTYDNYRSTHGMPLQPVNSITFTEVQMIYNINYWLPTLCASLPQPVDLCVFDTAVNSGPQRAVKMLQQAVGVEQDGLIGPGTLAATNALTPLAVATQFCDEREAYVRGIAASQPSQQMFLNGWLNRVDALRTACGVAR